MKIVILSSGHNPFDERIFWKFGRSLNLQGFQVIIITSTEHLQAAKEGIIIDSFAGKNMKKKEKVNYFFNLLLKYRPQIIICCEPITILAASRFRKTSSPSPVIISDVTEWYPENYTIKLKGLTKIIQYFFLWLFNIYTIQFVDGIIAGENLKLRRYKIIAPYKKKAIIGYYPVLQFFNYYPPPFNGQYLTLCYAGLINFKRGILKMVEVCTLLKQNNPSLDICLKIIGQFENSGELSEFQRVSKSITNFKVQLVDWSEYPVYSVKLADADICLDLRVRNFVYRNSLPIKVFEYMAAGKPTIFSDIRPLHEIKQSGAFIHLVDPNDIPLIVKIIEEYLRNKDRLLIDSREARKLVEEKYNWESESLKLLHFLESFINKKS
jgi:glycosyltransferase involved in cell wall biosynthesis